MLTIVDVSYISVAITDSAPSHIGIHFVSQLFASKFEFFFVKEKTFIIHYHHSLYMYSSISCDKYAIGENLVI